MNPEHVKVTINNALDLLQLITEDLEENFITGNMDNAEKARATMTLSAWLKSANGVMIYHGRVKTRPYGVINGL